MTLLDRIGENILYKKSKYLWKNRQTSQDGVGRHGGALRCQARSSLHAQVRQSTIACTSEMKLSFSLYRLLNFTDGRFIRPHLRRKEIESLCKGICWTRGSCFWKMEQTPPQSLPPISSQMRRQSSSTCPCFPRWSLLLVLALQGDPCYLSLLSNVVIHTLESVFVFRLWQSCLQVARSTCFEKSRLLLDRLVDARYHNIWVFSCWQISILVLANISIMQVKY